MSTTTERIATLRSDEAESILLLTRDPPRGELDRGSSDWRRGVTSDGLPMVGDIRLKDSRLKNLITTTVKSHELCRQ